MSQRSCKFAHVFTQQGVVSHVNQYLSSHVSREKHVSVPTPRCFATISSLSPNTHVFNMSWVSRYRAAASEWDDQLAGTTSAQDDGSFPCVCGTGQRGCMVAHFALAFHCIIYGGRCESVTAASCAQCFTQSVTQIQDDFTDCTTMWHTEKGTRITMRPLITCCSQGWPLSAFSRKPLGGGLWPFSQLPLETVLQLLQISPLQNLKPTSLITAGLLTSLSRSPCTGQEAQTMIHADTGTSQQREVRHRFTWSM